MTSSPRRRDTRSFPLFQVRDGTNCGPAVTLHPAERELTAVASVREPGQGGLGRMKLGSVAL